LQGKAAGVLINSESGQPGGSTSIRVRGYGALNYNEPLIVVDGVIMNTYSGEFDNPSKIGATPANDILSSINPADIESVNILKDASASAIYGSRAGNGVVLITTKKGKAETTRIDYNAYYGIQSLERKIDMMTGPQYARFSNDARNAAGMVPYAGYANPDTLPTTDWQDELFRTAPLQSHQLALSGGSKKSQYYISVGYYDQQGIVLNSDFSRFSLRLNSDHQITDRLKVGNTLLLSQANSNSLPNGNLHSGVVLGSLRMPSYIPVSVVQNGTTNYYGVGDYESLFAGRTGNPVHSALRSQNLSDMKKGVGNLYLEFEIFDGLKIKSDVGLDYTFAANRSFEQSFENIPYINPNELPISFRQVPMATSRNYMESNTSLDLLLTYIKVFGKNNFTLLAGHTAQLIRMNDTYTTSSGHITNNVTTTAAGDPTTHVGSNSLADLAYESYIARAMYNYDGKYYLSYSYRRDGSSRFGSGLKFANFHAVSGAWRISAEPFMKSLDYIYDWKIRGSWGQTGVDGSLPSVEYPELQDHYTYVFNGNQIVSGYAPVGVPNPTLRWETAQQIDLGFDLLLFNGKLEWIFDLFHKRQFDIITERPIPFLLGTVDGEYTPTFPKEVVNGPEVINQGIENTLNINGTIGTFSYRLGSNLSVFRNEITKLEDQIPSDSYNGYNIVLNSYGYSINQFYGFKTDGIITNENDPALERQPNASLGDVKFIDLNNDQIINDSDRTFIGSPIPDFTLGFNITLQYKDFDFSTAFQGVYGNEIYNANLGWVLSSKDGGNRHSLMVDRWSEDNPDGKYPRAIATDPNFNSRASDLFLEDGSYMRIKTMEIGYTLPSAVTSRLKLSNMRIYISGQNLFTWSSYTGYSPEVGARGIDASVYPVARKFISGIRISI
jgi:TonB-linked SusC/RagA family outer membrane protein